MSQVKELKIIDVAWIATKPGGGWAGCDTAHPPFFILKRLDPDEPTPSGPKGW
jgi:hypothetical protein